mmetsp:Transcript_71212/g.225088  ORF Transcript_71212/g.225088 Transcript_71212/m.225088 type:complete len:200 (-) Transcript_71212:48-647(-)
MKVAAGHSRHPLACTAAKSRWILASRAERPWRSTTSVIHDMKSTLHMGPYVSWSNTVLRMTVVPSFFPLKVLSMKFCQKCMEGPLQRSPNSPILAVRLSSCFFPGTSHAATTSLSAAMHAAVTALVGRGCLCSCRWYLCHATATMLLMLWIGLEMGDGIRSPLACPEAKDYSSVPGVRGSCASTVKSEWINENVSYYPK